MLRLGPTKRRKSKCSECVECFGHWTVFMCWTESGLCTRVMGNCRADPQRSQFHPTNLFLSLNLWCKDLVPQKNRKRKCSECVECFSHWTVFMHWTESGLWHEGFKELTHKGVSSTQKNLFLSLNLWCKNLVPQKKEMQWVCWKFWLLDCFDHRGSCCLSRMFSLLQSSLTHAAL